MKKTLLSFVMLVFAMFTASAQTNLIENGDFETWAEGAPVNWKSTTTASSAVLEETTDAHSGAKAVLVKGASSNKRLAYKELDLKAGTYKMTFFVKAATAEGGSARPGYVPVKADGSVDGNGYKYGDYSNELTAEWREVIHEFTLAADTKVNILVMNPKKPGKDIIIDDFSLTTTDGGSGEGGGEVKPEPQPEPQPEEVIFSETFAKDQGAFTIDNKVVPEGVTVWTHADYNGKAYMKATAFVKGQGGADAESWLVSPVIDLTKQTEATLSFDQAANFFKGFDGFNVKVKAEGGEWANLEVANNAKGDSWNFVTSTADLKAFCGKKVQIAFVYTSAVATTGTWEVMNVKVTKKAGEVKPEPQPEPQPEDEAIFSETFAKDQGAFTIDNKVVPEGVTVWTHADYNGKAYMKATAFVKGQGGADAESWLVSPVIDLTKQTEATLSFDQAANFFKGFDGFNVKVKAEGGEWTNLEVANNAKGDSWNFVTSTADLKAFCGKKVQIAFVYTSAVATTGTWEVMNVKVTKKAGEVKPEPQPEPQPEEALYSADFSADMCGFTIENKKLTGGLTEVWKHDVNYKQMKGTATVKEGKDFIKNEAESWVISPVIDLAKAKNANLSFTSIANFFNDQATFAASCFVKVKVEGQAEWTNVVVEGLPDGKSWGKVTSTADLKAFDGKKIQLAFVYTSTTEVAGTWEFTNVKIANKAGEVNPDPQPQPEATVYTTIAELKKNAAEKAAKVTFKFNDLLVAAKVYDNLYLTDGKEAFMTYGSKNTFNVGDKISGEFTGDLVSFKGTIEFKNVDFAATKVASSNNTIPAKDVTLAQLADANNFGALQSMWVRVKGVKVDSAAFNSNKNINMVDGTHTVVLRDKTGAAAKFAFDTKATYDFYGVVDMFGGKMQIALLSDEDIEMVSTGIEGVEAEKGEDVIYDLAGRRVAKATKGLFIINGVKTFVK